MKVVSVANQKGGCGKTTTAANIAINLSQDGNKVLLVDLDPQGNLTTSLGIKKNMLENTIYDVMVRGEYSKNVIIKTVYNDLYIIPSTMDLATAEIELVSKIGREYSLDRYLKGLTTYDVVIIDTPPSLGLFTINALTASDYILIPIQAEFFALEGLTQLMRVFDLVRERLNSRLRIIGMVITMYDARTRSSHEIVDDVKKHHGNYVFDSIIPRNVTVTDSTMVGEPIVIYRKDAPASIAYRKLSTELENLLINGGL